MSPARTAWRLFTVGGMISFRGLFHWLSPWIYVPSLVLAPVFQILLFAYVGRSAGVGNDQFFVIGNAVQYSAIPCLFAMGQTVAGERWHQTLGLVLTSPAPRVPLFLGRSLPVMVNGWITSMVALVVGGLLLGVHFSLGVLAAIAVVMAVASISCTGLGLVLGALDLRVREGPVINNIAFGILLILTGANVPLDTLPGFMAALGRLLPLTHAIQAAREIADGASLGQAFPQIGWELLIGALCVVAGLVLLRWMEKASRRSATLELL